LTLLLHISIHDRKSRLRSFFFFLNCLVVCWFVLNFLFSIIVVFLLFFPIFSDFCGFPFCFRFFFVTIPSIETKMLVSVACAGFRLKWGYCDSLELAIYEKVAAYVLFLILRVGTGHSSMKDKSLTTITLDASKGSVHAGGYHLKLCLAGVMMVWWVKKLRWQLWGQIWMVRWLWKWANLVSN